MTFAGGVSALRVSSASGLLAAISLVLTTRTSAVAHALHQQQTQSRSSSANSLCTLCRAPDWKSAKSGKPSIGYPGGGGVAAALAADHGCPLRRRFTPVRVPGGPTTEGCSRLLSFRTASSCAFVRCTPPGQSDWGLVYSPTKLCLCPLTKRGSPATVVRALVLSVNTLHCPTVLRPRPGPPDSRGPNTAGTSPLPGLARASACPVRDGRLCTYAAYGPLGALPPQAFGCAMPWLSHSAWCAPSLRPMLYRLSFVYTSRPCAAGSVGVSPVTVSTPPQSVGTLETLVAVDTRSMCCRVCVTPAGEAMPLKSDGVSPSCSKFGSSTFTFVGCALALCMRVTSTALIICASALGPYCAVFCCPVRSKHVSESSPPSCVWQYPM